MSVKRFIPGLLLWAALAFMGRGLADPPDLLVTSGLRGRLEGEGGLPQRAARLRSLRNEGPVVLVEAGQVFYGAGAAPEAPDIIAELYSELDVDALHLTPADVSGGLEEVRGLMSRYSLPGISSNLVDADTGEPLFPTGVTVTREGHTYRMIGISVPPHASFPLPPGVRVEDPADALAREMARSDHPVILLYSGSPLVAFRALRPYADRIAAIAVSGQGRASRIAGIPAVYGGEEGRGIGRLPLAAPEQEAEFIRLTRQAPSDSAVEQLLQQRLEESGKEQRTRRAALRPGPPARLPPVGQPSRLMSSAAHQGIGLRVYQWSLEDSQGPLQAPEGQKLLVIEAGIENRLQSRLTQGLDYPEAVQVASFDNKLFLSVNQRRLIPFDDRALQIPDHLPKRFVLSEPGAVAEGRLVFLVPDRDFHQLELLLFHDEFPALSLPLLQPEEEAPSAAPVSTDENEVASFALHGVERQDSPREGFVRFRLDLRGQSRMTRQADSAALSPEVDPEGNRKVPHALPLKFDYFQDLVALEISRERSVGMEKDVSEFPSVPYFPPDRALGGALVFDVPEALADHDMNLRVWFPTLTLAGEGRGRPVTPEPLSLEVQEGPELEIPAAALSLPDGDLTLHLLDMVETGSFHSLEAPEGKRFISVLLRLENRSEESGLMPIQDRFGLLHASGRIPVDQERSRQGAFHPSDPFYLPAGGGRVFEVLFTAPETGGPWRFEYRGTTEHHQVEVTPSPGPEATLETGTATSRPQEEPSLRQVSEAGRSGGLNPALAPGPVNPLPLEPQTWPPPDQPDEEQLVIDPPGEGRPVGGELPLEDIDLTVHRMFVLDSYYGEEAEEGMRWLALELEAARKDGGPDWVKVSDLSDRLLLRMNQRTLLTMSRFGKTDPQFPDTFTLNAETPTLRRFVFYTVPAASLATAELVWAPSAGRPQTMTLLPEDEEAFPAQDPILQGENEMVYMGVHSAEIRESFFGREVKDGAWVVVDLRGRSLLPSGEEGGVQPAIWRDWRPRLQLIVDGVRSIEFDRRDFQFDDQARFLPELTTGGLFGFAVPQEVLENAGVLQLQCGFAPVAVPGEKVITPQPLYFTLKGDPDSLPTPPEPEIRVEDLHLTFDLLRIQQPETIGNRKVGEGQTAVQLDIAVTATADQGVMFKPDDWLEGLRGDRTKLRPHRHSWYGPAHPPRHGRPTWIPKNGRREFSLFWEMDNDALPVKLRINGVRHYKALPLVPGGKADVDPESDSTISERGMRVLNLDAEPGGIDGVGLTAQQVNNAIDRGKAYLWQELQEYRRRRISLLRKQEFYIVLLALVHSDAHLENPELDREIRAFIQESPIRDNNVYQNALLAKLIEGYGDPAFLPQMEQIAHYLVESQGEGGTWTYRATTPKRFYPEKDVSDEETPLFRVEGGQPLADTRPPQEPVARTQSWTLGKDGDHSCTQFAVLGLWAAERSGVKIDDEVWERVADHMSRSQVFAVQENHHGGYGYHGAGGAYGSMTAAGVCVLALAYDRLFDGQPREHLRIRNALGWLARNFSVSVNPVAEKYNYYYLYSLERVGQILGIEFIADQEWYPQGARYLVKRQSDDGSWPTGKGEDDPLLTTSYALLFLTRATASLEAEPTPEPQGPGELETRVVRPDTSRRLYLILDASGSMRAEINGKRKLDIARDAVMEMVSVLPEDTRIAIRAYGHRRRAIEADAKTDTELILPWEPLNPATVREQLDRLRTRGKTPMALSLREGVSEIPGGEGKNLLVLLTDGGENERDTDPVDAASLFAGREDVDVFIVGFDINRADWTRQLQAMADAAGGTYRPVKEAALLAAELKQKVYPPAPGFRVVDPEGQDVAASTFGDPPLQLDKGEYRLQTDSTDVPFETEFRIRPQGVTRITLDMARLPASSLSPPPPTPAAEPDPEPAAAPAFCTHCGSKLKPDARFCTRCGTPVQ